MALTAGNTDISDSDASCSTSEQKHVLGLLYFCHMGKMETSDR